MWDLLGVATGDREDVSGPAPEEHEGNYGMTATGLRPLPLPPEGG